MALNQQNFEGRVFSHTPQQSYYTTQGVQSVSQRDMSITAPNSYYQPSQANQTVHFQSFRKSFDLYERSRSIDSIKVAHSKEYSTVENNKHPFSAFKANPANI